MFQVVMEVQKQYGYSEEQSSASIGQSASAPIRLSWLEKLKEFASFGSHSKPSSSVVELNVKSTTSSGAASNTLPQVSNTFICIEQVRFRLMFFSFKVMFRCDIILDIGAMLVNQIRFSYYSM